MDNLDDEIVQALEHDAKKWARIERENRILRNMIRTEPLRAKRVIFKALHNGGLSPQEYRQIFGDINA